MRAEVERRLGRTLEDFALPPPAGELRRDHVGVHPQKQAGLFYVGVPVHLGLVSGEQMVAVADLAERLGGDVRLTRQQNFVLTGVPEEQVDEAVAELERDRLPARRQPRPRRLDRLHRRAALQLLGDRDEDAGSTR